MISFPPCKINLGLNVISKRVDGFHNIETCYYPVPWTDVLEIIPAKNNSSGFSGIRVPGNSRDNLCWKAWTLFQKEFGIPDIQLHLHKVIPIGAGLGGGSSDAAGTLIMLNNIFSLGLGLNDLLACASRLGSDCPFFVESKPMLGRDKGDRLEPVELSLDGKFLVLVQPGIHVGTADAYRNVIPKPPEFPIATTLALPIREWREKLVNDFETSVFARHPELQMVKQILYQHGALFASMSGSGSSVFGLFDRKVDLRNAFPEMQLWSGWLTR